MPLERVVKALYDYEAAEGDELTFSEDDLLAVTITDNEEWLMATRLDDGTSGLIPINYVEDLEGLAIMRAGFDYTANEQNELDLKEGEMVCVMNRVEDEWWLVRNEAGVFGLVPANYLEEPSEAGKESQQIHFESHWKAKFVDGKKKFEGIFGLTDDQHVAFLSQDSAKFMVPLKSVNSFEGGILHCNDGKSFILELSARDALAFSKLINVSEEVKTVKVSKEYTYMALYDYEADAEDELCLKEGDKLSLIEHQDEDWSFVALPDGTSGLVPRSYIVDTLSKEFEQLSVQSWTEVKSSDYRQSPEVISNNEDKQSTSAEVVSESTSINELNRVPKVAEIPPPPPMPTSPTILKKDNTLSVPPPPPPLPIPVSSPTMMVKKSPVTSPSIEMKQTPSPKQAEIPPPPPPPMPVSIPDEPKTTISAPKLPPMTRPEATQDVKTSPKFVTKSIDPQSSSTVKLPTVNLQQKPLTPSNKSPVTSTPLPNYQQKSNTSASSLSPKEDFTHARASLKPSSPILATTPTPSNPQITSTNNEDQWEVPKRVVPNVSVKKESPQVAAPKAPISNATTKPQWITKNVSNNESSPPITSPKEQTQTAKMSPTITSHRVEENAIKSPVSSVTSPKINRPSLSELAKKYGNVKTSVSKPPELPKPVENPWSNLSIKKPSTQPVPVKKSLPDRPAQASSSAKPKPGNTRLWNDRSGKFQVEAEYLSFKNGQVKLLKLNGKEVAVPLDMLSERDVEFVYRKEGLPIETPQSQNSTSPSPGTWLTLLLEVGIDRSRASTYSQTLAKEKLVPAQFGDLTRDFLKAHGFIEADILVLLKAAAKKKAIALEQSAARSNLDRVRSMSKSPEGSSIVPYKFNPTKSPSLSPTTSNAPIVYEPSSITTFSTSTQEQPKRTTYTATQTLETTKTQLQRTSIEPVTKNGTRSPPIGRSNDDLPTSTATNYNNNINTNYSNNMDIQPYERPQSQHLTSYQPPPQTFQQHYQHPPMPTYAAPVPSYAPPMHSAFPYAPPPMPQVHHNIVVTKYTTSNNSSQGSANSFSQQRPHVQRPPMMGQMYQQQMPYPNPYQQQPFPPQFPPQNPFMNPFQQFPPGGSYPPYGHGGYY